MRRRDVLRGGAGVLGLSLAGRASAHPDAHFEPLGSVDVDGATEAVVGEDGQVTYVAASDGLVTVDVTDPASPEILAEERDLLSDRDGGEFGLLFDCAVDGDRLVIVGPANRATGVIRGVLLYDVSDPAAPEQLAFHGTEYPIHNAEFEDGVVYLTGIDGQTNPLVIVDASDDDLTEVGRWSPLDHDDAWAAVSPLLRPIHDVHVQEGLAYLSYWDAGTWLVDVSDPAAPSYVSRIGTYTAEDLAVLDTSEARRRLIVPPGNAHSCAISDDGTVLGVGTESWEAPGEDGDLVGGPGGVVLWDVSDPAEPERLSDIPAPVAQDNTRDGQFTTAHNFEIAGGRLYSSLYYAGLKIHDLSDPSLPTRVAWWRNPDEASFWTAQLARPDECVVASSSEGTESVDLVEQGRLYTFPDGPIDDDELPGQGGDGGNGGDDGSPLPGFGAGAAALGLGLGAWRAARSEQ
jgi:hypothetical protein